MRTAKEAAEAAQKLLDQTEKLRKEILDTIAATETRFGPSIGKSRHVAAPDVKQPRNGKPVFEK